MKPGLDNLSGLFFIEKCDLIAFHTLSRVRFPGDFNCGQSPIGLRKRG